MIPYIENIIIHNPTDNTKPKPVFYY